MPDLAPLTDDQRAALRELDSAMTMLTKAIERRIQAERDEALQRDRIYQLGYEIAGVK